MLRKGCTLFDPRHEKTCFCICENKCADQLRSKCAAGQRISFRYTHSTTHLLPKSQISSLCPSSVAVQPVLCWTWSEPAKTGFVMTRLIYCGTPRAFHITILEEVSTEHLSDTTVLTLSIKHNFLISNDTKSTEICWPAYA